MAGEERFCASGVSAPLGRPSRAVDPRSTCGNPYRYAGGGVSAAIAKQLEKSRRRARAPGSTHFQMKRSSTSYPTCYQRVMSVHVKGFGCRPLEGRRRVFGGRRPKASKGGNRAGGT